MRRDNHSLIMAASQNSIIADPYWSSVRVMMPLDDLTDESGYTTPTTGGVTFDATDPLDAPYSAVFEQNSGDYIGFDSTVFNTGSSDFTLESYIRITTMPAVYGVFLRSNSQGFDIGFRPSGFRLIFDVYLNGGAIALLSSFTPADDTTFVGEWRHIAVTRSGNTWRCFWHGTKVDEQVRTNSVTSNDENRLGGSSFSVNHTLPCRMQYFRYTLGVARYTADFTPPTTPFPEQ
jgi:hypothetical protein